MSKLKLNFHPIANSRRLRTFNFHVFFSLCYLIWLHTTTSEFHMFCGWKEMGKRLDMVTDIEDRNKRRKKTNYNQTNNNERLIVICFDESKRNLNITWSSKSFCVVSAAAAAVVRCNVKALKCATAAFNWNALYVFFFKNLCGT